MGILEREDWSALSTSPQSDYGFFSTFQSLSNFSITPCHDLSKFSLEGILKCLLGSQPTLHPSF